MKTQLNETKRMQQIAGILNENQGMQNLNLSEEGLKKWFYVADALERDGYDLRDYNHLQINTLFREFQFIEANKELSDEELANKFEENLGDIIG